jgi:hypothetical protein
VQTLFSFLAWCQLLAGREIEAPMRVLPSLMETPSLGIEDGAGLRGEAMGVQLASALP